MTAITLEGAVTFDARWYFQ